MLRVSSSKRGDLICGSGETAFCSVMYGPQPSTPLARRMLSACDVDEAVDAWYPAGKSDATKAPARAMAASPDCDAAATAVAVERDDQERDRECARRSPESRAHHPQCMGSTRAYLITLAPVATRLTRARPVLVRVATAVVFLVLVQVLWGPPAGIVVQGALLGGLERAPRARPRARLPRAPDPQLRAGRPRRGTGVARGAARREQRRELGGRVRDRPRHRGRPRRARRGARDPPVLPIAAADPDRRDHRPRAGAGGTRAPAAGVVRRRPPAAELPGSDRRVVHGRAVALRRQRRRRADRDPPRVRRARSVPAHPHRSGDARLRRRRRPRRPGRHPGAPRPFDRVGDRLDAGVPGRVPPGGHRGALARHRARTVAPAARARGGGDRTDGAAPDHRGRRDRARHRRAVGGVGLERTQRRVPGAVRRRGGGGVAHARRRRTARPARTVDVAGGARAAAGAPRAGPAARGAHGPGAARRRGGARARAACRWCSPRAAPTSRRWRWSTGSSRCRWSCSPGGRARSASGRWRSWRSAPRSAARSPPASAGISRSACWARASSAPRSRCSSACPCCDDAGSRWR